MSTFQTTTFRKVNDNCIGDPQLGLASMSFPIPSPSYRPKSWWKSINARFEGYASLKLQRICSLLMDSVMFLVLVIGVDLTSSVFYGISLELSSISLWGYLIASFISLVVLNYSTGVYPGFGLHSKALSRIRWVVVAFVCSFLGMGCWMGAFHIQGFALVCSLIISHNALSMILIRKIHERLAAKKLWGTPVVIIGAGVKAQRIIRWLKQNPQLGLMPYVCLDNNEKLHNTKCAGIKVAGSLDMAHDLLDYANAAIIADDYEDQLDTQTLAAAVVFPQIVKIVPNDNHVEGIDAYKIKIKRQVNCGKTIWLKRAVDLTLGVFFLVVSLPIIAVLAICIKVLSKGPAFYSQERIGYAGKVIRIWKLRTMYTDSEQRLEKYLAENPEAHEQWHRCFKLDNDPRILPYIGTILRKSSLDELPQFLNVVRGDMTLVGPRPFPQYHLKHFPSTFQTLRQAVMPGLTGLWQVSERSNGDLTTQQRGDSTYIKHWSIKLDFQILVRTVICVLRCKGAK